MLLRAPRPKAVAGFTLVEILVVLVILGSLFSLALFSSNDQGRQRELRTEAERLAALIGLLADQAVLDSREYGLLIELQGYRVLGYEESTGLWQPLAEEREHRLPDGMELVLELDGQPLQLVSESPTSAEQVERGAATQPQLIILSSGELSPFRLEVRARQGHSPVFRLASDGFQLPEAEAAVAAR